MGFDGRCQMQCIQRLETRSQELLCPRLDRSVRLDELRGLRNRLSRKVSANIFRIRIDLKDESLGRNQFGPTVLAEGENAQDRLCLDTDTKLSLVIDWTLQAAHVEVDSHAGSLRVAMGLSNDSSTTKIAPGG